MKKNKKRNYKYAWGGDVDPDVIGQIGMIGGNVLGGIVGQDTQAGGFLSGAGSGAGIGASIGSAVPGIGTAIGAIGGGLIGGIGGLLGASSKQKEAKRQAALQKKNFTTSYVKQIEGQTDTVNSNPYGNLVFANGGMIPIDPTKPYKTPRGNEITDEDLAKTFKATGIKWGTKEEYGAWLDKFAAPLPARTNSKTTYPYGKRGEVMTQDEWNYSRSKRGYDDVYSDGKQGTDNFIPGESYANSIRNDIKEYRGLIGGKMATGGEVDLEQINIEQGELQIDPVTGKIMRKYIGINPENGELYKPHSKGKDPKANFVTAEPGTFIITTKLAKDYEDAIDTNDKVRRDTILQNIKNTKDKKDKAGKMAYGSFVDPTKPPYLSAINPDWSADRVIANARGLPSVNPQVPVGATNVTGNFNTSLRPISSVDNDSDGFNLGNLANQIGNFAPALANIGQGLFGKVEQTPNVQAIANPYTNQVLNNMPEEVSLNPLVNRINRNQTAQFKQIDNTTSGNAVARANKNNVFATTQNNLSDVFMQQQQVNNQIKGQRGSIYNNLGQQQVQEQARAQQINLGINESNVANRAAKQNLLGTGLSQLQQVFQNNRANKSKQSMDKYKVDLLKQMFPNLKYYGDQFGEDTLAQLMGG